MDKIFTFLQGKKTYIIVLFGVALGVAQALGYMIPMWVDVVAGFLGIGTQRMAIQNQSNQTTKDVAALLKVILDQVNEATENKNVR